MPDETALEGARVAALGIQPEDLAGLLDSHHYGFTPNFIADLAATAFSTETSDADLDRALDSLAARDFGADNVAAIKAAWDEWDAAYPQDQLTPSIDRARREVAQWQAGCDKLETLLPSVPAEQRDAARQIPGVGRYCERTMRTLLYHRLCCREMLVEKPDADKVRAILRDETENVKATIPLVTADPRLGWEPSMRFVASPEILN